MNKTVDCEGFFSYKKNKIRTFMDLKIPYYIHKVGAGFPSPATDYIEDDVDLNTHLIKNSPATFIIRVQGKSMTSAGIYDGDLLIVDRSINPKHLSTVIANVNEELVVKTILKEKGKTFLASGSIKNSEKIHLGKDQEVIIWGVVTYVIHQVHN